MNHLSIFSLFFLFFPFSLSLSPISYLPLSFSSSSSRPVPRSFLERNYCLVSFSVPDRKNRFQSDLRHLHLTCYFFSFSINSLSFLSSSLSFTIIFFPLSPKVQINTNYHFSSLFYPQLHHVFSITPQIRERTEVSTHRTILFRIRLDPSVFFISLDQEGNVSKFHLQISICLFIQMIQLLLESEYLTKFSN